MKISSGDIVLLEDPSFCRFCSNFLATLMNFLVNSVHFPQHRIQTGLDLLIYSFIIFNFIYGGVVVVMVVLCCSCRGGVVGVGVVVV